MPTPNLPPRERRERPVACLTHGWITTREGGLEPRHFTWNLSGRCDVVDTAAEHAAAIAYQRGLDTDSEAIALGYARAVLENAAALGYTRDEAAHIAASCLAGYAAEPAA